MLASPGQVEFQLACPKRFVVGGLDAELSSRGIDIGFVGSLGSPVNPGITTSTSAVFLGRLVRGQDVAASFRPHIGCVPASGGGQRGQTAYHAFAPGKPTVRHVTQIVVRPGRTRHYVERCARNERLAAATHAIGFFGDAPPAVSLARSVRVVQTVHAGRVSLTIRAGRRSPAAAPSSNSTSCAQPDDVRPPPPAAHAARDPGGDRRLPAERRDARCSTRCGTRTSTCSPRSSRPAVRGGAG